MIRRLAVRALAIAGAIASFAGTAHADERECRLDPGTGELHCQIVATPAPARTQRLTPDLPLVWKRIPMNTDDLIARGHGCVRYEAGTTIIGAGYVIVLTNEDTLDVLYLEYVCQWPGDPPPVPPTRPPTPGEFVDANDEALALTPSLSPSAAIGGLTGLDSWLWCVDPGTVDAGVTLRGWTAVGTVRLVQTGWSIDGPTGIGETSTACGSEEAPAATWRPETKGDYSVVVTATWAGTWDLSWNGIPMGTFTLGPISIASAPQVYPVDEYRGELTE